MRDLVCTERVMSLLMIAALLGTLWPLGILVQCMGASTDWGIRSRSVLATLLTAQVGIILSWNNTP